MADNAEKKDLMFSSISDKYVREFYDSLLIKPRFIGSGAADTQAEFFGKKYATPIMIAPFTGSPVWAQAAKKAGTLFWTAHLREEDTEAVRGTVDFVATSKPVNDSELIISRIRRAEADGAGAFFIDIDHLFTPKTGGWYVGLDGRPMGVQTAEMLKRYAECSSLPIILKGVLDEEDAVAAKEAGIAAVVASHHHGMVLYSIPPAMAVENIRRAVGPDYTVLVDCGIESGIDAFKALALGADGVLVCRHLLPYFAEGGAEAVANRLEEMRRELAAYMSMTGAATLDEIRADCLVRKCF